ncbi:MAG: tetratricopeptide repeat protein [Paludibacteraceae bacterium]|nr:tetratricopeptide repeat protein [Paludibacteraceae bacterium]
MAKNVKEEESSIEVFDKADEVLNSGEAFIEKNQKSILIGLGIVALVVVGAILLKNQYFEPREREAQESIFMAEQFFAIDSFQLALDGKDDAMGFLEVIENYGSTDAGNLAKAYAGICYKKLGDDEAAIEYLKKFSADDKVVQPSVLGSVGDCYWNLGDVNKAVSYYKKAAGEDNEIMTPFYNERAALAYLSIEENDKALALLEGIVKKYPGYSNIMEVKKYIEFAKNK